MKIKLKRDCAIGGEHCEAGEVVEVNSRDGDYLVNAGIAEACEAKTKAKKQTVKKIKVLMTHTCLVAGEHREVGDEVLALEADAKFLLGHGHGLVAGSDEAKEFKAGLKKQEAAEKEAAEKEAAEKEAAEKEAAEKEAAE